MQPSLPSAPSLEQLRKQAKDLLRDARAGDQEALARVREHHPAGVSVRLSDAQLVVAREHGFPSWPRLKDYVERVAGGRDDLRHAFRADPKYHEDRASGLLWVVQGGMDTAIDLVRRHHPELATRANADLRAAMTIDDARLVQARQHGFPTWVRFRRHLQRLADEGPEPFMRAREAIDAHDADLLVAVLDRDPALLQARGTNGNDLLQLATATGDQRLVRLLLDRGAEPRRANDRGATPLHQAAYGDSAALARLLLDAGAPVDTSAYGDGGTPVVWALFGGNRETADLIAERGVAPRNLRVAAGLGRRDLIEELVGRDGGLAPQAGAHRGFYRPHTGFPPWEPSDDPQEILDEALVWAARNGRDDALPLLVDRGADVEGDPYRGTPLIWAAACDRVSTVERLIELGADPNGRGTFGGTSHGEGVTPLHLGAGSGSIAACRALLRAGADPALPDRLYHAPPWGFATYACKEAAARLMIAEAARTSLFSAVMTHDVESVRAAIAEHPEQLDDARYFATPLGLAISEDLLDVAELLLGAGADPTRAGMNGQSPVDLAEERGRHAHANLLRRHGA